MGSRIQVSVRPLSGVDDACAPAATLLTIDGATLLLDAGASTTTYTAPYLTQDLKNIDAILLSHASLHHTAGLPHAYKALQLSCPIYATLATAKMALMELYDAHEAAAPDEGYGFGAEPPWSLDDVDHAFSHVVELKYSQLIRLSGRAAGVSLMPLAAGTTLGGAIWVISKGTEEIVYAAEFNHQKERMLAGASFDALSKPTLLIARCPGASLSIAPRKQREAELVEAIRGGLESGRDVLLPADAAGRMLELVLLLEQTWRSDFRLRHFPVALAGPLAPNTLEYAKSQLEWMGEDVAALFDASHANPFSLRAVRVVRTIDEVLRLPSPKVVLTSSASANSGLSARLLAASCQSASVLTLFTQRPPRGSPAEALLTGAARDGLRVKVRERTPLEGAEREAAEAALAAKRAAVAATQKTHEAAEADEIIDDDEDGQEEAAATKVESANGDGGGGGGVPADESAEQPSTASPAAPARPPAPRRAQVLPFVEHFAVQSEWGELLTDEEWDAIARGGGAHTAAGELADMALNAANAKSAQRKKKAGRAMGDDGLEYEDGEAPEARYVDVADADDATDETEALDEEEVLSRYEPLTRVIPVRCQVGFVNFEGVSDGRSLSALFGALAPLHAVLVGTAPDVKRALAAHIKAAASTDAQMRISLPAVGEELSASSEAQLYRIKLDDSLFAALVPHTADKYSVARVRGTFRSADALSATAEQQKLRRGLAGVLAPCEKDATDEGRPVNLLSQGPLRIADLRSAFAKEGDQVELGSGRLLINNSVAIRKPEARRVLIEGAHGLSFLRARKRVLEQFLAL